jgi:hypothetical protein
MIISENRYPLFRIMLGHDHFGKPVSTFPDHALVMHENRQQDDNRQRNADQPKQ